MLLIQKSAAAADFGCSTGPDYRRQPVRFRRALVPNLVTVTASLFARREGSDLANVTALRVTQPRRARTPLKEDSLTRRSLAPVRPAYVTGKAFIPFYFAPDRARRAYFYRGLGRVVLAGLPWGDVRAHRAERRQRDGAVEKVSARGMPEGAIMQG